MSATDIRREIDEYYIYLNFVHDLMGIKGKDNRVDYGLKIVSEFIKIATSRELRIQGKQIASQLKDAVKNHATLLPRRKPSRQIARDFKVLSEEIDVKRFGIPYGWLAERFESAGLKQPTDLPPHARIGIGAHAGFASVEEAFLLEDTYLLLAHAEAANERMKQSAKKLNEMQIRALSEDEYKNISAINGNVCTFSRLCVVSAAAFIESFVNSVGYAESVRRNDLDDNIKEELRGMKKNRYLSLDVKLEKYPRILRPDGRSPIVLSDIHQREEPFTSFILDTKALRDSSMHYAPNKFDIWRTPQEWLASANRATENAIQVAEKFWTACFPDRASPEYLDHLCHERFLMRAIDKVRYSDGNESANTG